MRVSVSVSVFQKYASVFDVSCDQEKVCQSVVSPVVMLLLLLSTVLSYSLQSRMHRPPQTHVL